MTLTRFFWLCSLVLFGLVLAQAQPNKTQPSTTTQTPPKRPAKPTAKDPNDTIKVPEKVVIKRQSPNVGAGRVHDSLLRAEGKLSHIDGVYIPMDLLDCFRALDTLMEPEVRERFMAFSDEEVDRRTHKSLGFWLDHRWKLSSGSRLSLYFSKMGIPHPKYMAGMIIQTYHRKLHNRDLGVKELVAQYREHWKQSQRQKEEELYKQAYEQLMQQKKAANKQ